MGELVPMADYRSSDDEERILEWESGLPSAEDLPPLSQALIPPELASAFSITPEPRRTMIDVNRASRNTLASLRGVSQAFSSNNFADLPSFNEETIVEGDENDNSRKIRRLDSIEEADSAMRMENLTDDQSGRGSKRPRLVWTPQLHKRFVDVVAHLGIKNAVPKTIMQLMNVEGLTRENVASHLQKYRLYLKRMQGLSNEGPSTSDPLFASTPVPQNLEEPVESGHGNMGNGQMGHPIPMPYPQPMMHMPVYGMHGHDGRMGFPMANPQAYNGFESHHQYNMMHHQRDWSANNYNSVMSYPHGGPNDE